MEESKNRVAIVTGAGAGIGEETSYAYAKKGLSLALVDMDGDKLKNVEDKMKTMGISADKLLSIECDIAEESSYDYIMEQTVGKFGRIDVLVNNAGYNRFFSFDEMTVEAVDKCFKVMLRAPLFLSQKAFPHLKKTKGCIVNMSSICSRIVVKPLMDYCAIKAGLEHLTKNLALEGAPHGIRVNSVHPGIIRTSILLPTAGATELEKLYEEEKENVPLGRVGAPADIASAVLYLSSDAASYVTGTSLLVDGGALLVSPWNGLST